MLSIGEFSLASGIPVRTLRFYHEQGLLVPAAIDLDTKYRSYDLRNLELARVIVALRSLEFSLDDIRTILAHCESDADVVLYLKRQRTEIAKKLRHYRHALDGIDRVLEQHQLAQEAQHMNQTAPQVIERDLEPLLVAGIRMTGRYSDCGLGFATLGKRLGRHIAGKPLCLFYDGEYRDEDANFEPCMPLRKPLALDGIEVHELPAAHCATLLHHGPYEELSKSYARLLKYIKEHGYEITLPTREVYIKGPGMIFRGNPKKYVTEIQFPIA